MVRLRREGRKSRKSNNRNERPSTCLIMTEGIETEVNYFGNMRDIINKRFQQREIETNYPIKVEGTGKSTSVLVNEAIKRRSQGNFSDVWVVFDKDANIDFDEAIKLAKDNNIKVAWSNESFELWLLLHFQDLYASVQRDSYNQKLDRHFKTLNLNNGSYSKTIPNIFDITKDRVDQAISRSEKLKQEYKEDGVFSQTSMNPCTTVDALVNELLPYIRE